MLQINIPFQCFWNKNRTYFAIITHKLWYFNNYKCLKTIHNA